MKPDQLLRAMLPDVLIDNFDIDRFEKTDSRFDIWLDEKKEQLREDKYNKDIIYYGLEIPAPYRIIRYGDGPRTSMYGSASGSTKQPGKYSAMSGMYPSSTAQGLTPSLSLF